MVGDTVSGSSYCNNFHDFVIYRQPSIESLNNVDQIIANQNPFDVTNIQFTSGTTGSPKAATLTHHNLLNNAFNAREIMEFSPMDRACLTVPMYHCFGSVGGTMLNLVSGSTLILPWPTFHPIKSLEVAEKYQCTTIYGVPTMFIEFIKVAKAQSFDLGRLNKSIMGGSNCPKQLILEMKEYLGIDYIHVVYGMTETSPVSFMVRRDDPIDKKSTTAGKIMDNIEAKIVSPDGQTVPIGEVGELAVKGYSVMPGYYKDPEANAKNILDGWMMTGDLVRFDDEGYLIVEGRIKDIIIRGGENISSKEIEEKIFEISEVENVQIIGVPDPKYQEEVCAFIKLRPGANFSKEDVFEYLNPILSYFKVPKYVKFVESFPMTVTGKIQKFKMIDEWIKETQEMTDSQLRETYTIR